LGLGTSAGIKKTRMVGYWTEKEVSSRMDTIHQRAGQSDGQTDTGRSKDRAYA